MVSIGNIKVRIDLTEMRPDFEPEELEKLTKRLAEDLEEIAENVSLVRDAEIPARSKTGLAGVIWGVLKTEVTLENVRKLLGYLGIFSQNEPLELEFTANGNTYRLQYRNNQQLESAVQAVERLTQLAHQESPIA